MAKEQKRSDCIDHRVEGAASTLLIQALPQPASGRGA